VDKPSTLSPERLPHPQVNHTATPDFDCFLSHNSKDKPAVRELAAALRAAGVAVWLDEEQLRPGLPWQPQLAAGIAASRSVAVLVGADGLGPWEDEEQQAALTLAVRDHRPVIPVLLPGVPQAPPLPLFLANRTWVDLRPGAAPGPAAGLDLLIWGITGRRPVAAGGAAADAAKPPAPGPAAAGPTGAAPPPDRGRAPAPPGPVERPPKPAPTRRAGARDGRCDVLLLYVNDKERAAIVETFKGPRGALPQPRSIKGIACLDLGTIGGRRIVAMGTNMGSATPGGTATLALDAIKKLDPQWIIAVGVAFGMDPQKTPIGTILVSERVSCYEPQRVGRTKTIFRGDTVSVDPHLKQHLQTVSAAPFWTGAAVRFGELLSGEKLIDEPGFKGKLRRTYPEAIGGEMEAAGIYSAAMLERCAWIVVKAVCDYADGNKAEDKGARQAQAATNAATFVRHCLNAYGPAGPTVRSPGNPDAERDQSPRRTAQSAQRPDAAPDQAADAQSAPPSPVHQTAPREIAANLEAVPALVTALAAHVDVAPPAGAQALAAWLCRRDAEGVRVAMAALRQGVRDATQAVRRAQGDLTSLRERARAILGWMSVVTVLDDYGWPQAPKVKERWFDGAAFRIPLGRNACIEVLAARWASRPADFGSGRERWDYGRWDISPHPKADPGMNQLLRMDPEPALNYVRRLVYQHIEGKEPPPILDPDTWQELRERVAIRRDEKGEQRRIVLDGRGAGNAFDYAAVLRAIHLDLPEVHLIVLVGPGADHPEVFLLPAARLSGQIKECLEDIEALT